MGPSRLWNCWASASSDLFDCPALVTLPPNLGCLAHNYELDCSGCTALAELPDSIGDIQQLIRGGSVAIGTELPGQPLCTTQVQQACRLTSYAMLQAGSKADWQYMQDLQRRPHRCLHTTSKLIPGPACRLELDFCSALRQLPAGLTRLSNLADLDATWCDGLEELPEQLGSLRGLTRLDLAGCERLQTLPDSTNALTGGLPRLPEMAAAGLADSLALTDCMCRLLRCCSCCTSAYTCGS